MNHVVTKHGNEALAGTVMRVALGAPVEQQDDTTRKAKGFVIGGPPGTGSLRGG